MLVECHVRLKQCLGSDTSGGRRQAADAVLTPVIRLTDIGSGGGWQDRSVLSEWLTIDRIRLL
jgi:hypothetical protein